jgi:hypothetical protein
MKKQKVTIEISDLSRLWQIIHETKGIIISLNENHCAEYIRKDEVEGVLTRLIKFK